MEKKDTWTKKFAVKLEKLISEPKEKIVSDADTNLVVTSFKISKQTHKRIMLAKHQLGIKNLDMLFKYLLELLPKK